ncbi:MAG: protein kinase [Rhodospirillaceae bacterium]|nr:protein kinase [Rhodospirillaceae bacterium]
MPISTNQNALIKQLENAHLINGRYENLNCVNVHGGNRRGVLSLVFQGYDRISKKFVAIKVMDPDRLSNAYRIRAFEREPTILENLEGKNRCLQIIDGLQHYRWEVKYPGSSDPLKFECGFFTIEWLEEDADEFFLEQQNYNSIQKLEIFRQLLLAVEAIHRAQVFHRDIKVDNIRLKSIKNNSALILIDFGTAAQFHDPSIATTYTDPVGAPAFSPPEAFVGFAGERDIGMLSDSYALGAILFNLFNYREFRHARDRETRFHQLLAAIAPLVARSNSRKDKIEVWSDHMHRFRHLSYAPAIDGPGSTLSIAVLGLIKDVYSQLIEFDFLRRTSDLVSIRRRVDSALKLLDNHKREEIELRRRRLLRKRRQEKIQRRKKRLEKYIGRRLLESA